MTKETPKPKVPWYKKVGQTIRDGVGNALGKAAENR